MTLKDKIKALKIAASDPMSRDPMSPFQQFRQKKVEERIDTLFNRGVKPPVNKQETYHIQKFLQKGIKVKPQKPGIKQYNKMVSAKENKEKLRQMFAEEEDVIKKFKKLKVEEGKDFSYDPREDKIIGDEEAREKYGKPGMSMHYIPVTNNPGDVEELRTEWDKRHPKKKEAEEEKNPPHFIGVWHDKKEGKKYTDISYILNSNDPDEVQEHLQKTNQRYTYTVHPDMKTEYIENKKYKAPKEAQYISPQIDYKEIDLNEEIIEDSPHPILFHYQGKAYKDLQNIFPREIELDKSFVAKLEVENIGQNRLKGFKFESNAPHEARLPMSIKPGERAKMALKFEAQTLIAMKREDKSITTKLTYDEVLREF